MMICDTCKGEIKDNHIQISVRGEQRMKIYDYGFEDTHFEVCSAKCGIELLHQIKTLIGEVIKL